jgi:outer membrane receptor protein involved in Fe transport
MKNQFFPSLLLSTAIASITFSLVSNAQSNLPAGSQAGQSIEEVIVTADFRDSELMTAAGSITVVDDTVFQQRAAQHLESVLNTAPNIDVGGGGSRVRFIQIRGIGDLEQFSDPKYYPSVGLMLDDLELGDAANAGMLFDIAQLEVLRGPQGTRLGASAHAGMIQLRANEPTDEFEGVVSGGIGNANSYNAGLVLSGPLTSELKARLAVQSNQSDGYIENAYLGRDDTNNLDEVTARLKLQWTPSEAAQYDLSLFSFDSDNGADTWSLDNERVTYSDQPGSDEQETLAVTVKGQWQLKENQSLLAVVSHTDSDLSFSYDADWISDDFCVTYLCSYGNDTSRESFERDRQKLTADLRWLIGPDALAAGEVRYILGAYFNNNSETLNYYYPSLWYGNYASDSDYETNRLAIYGEYEYAVSDQLTLTGGVRSERFDDDYSDSNGFESTDDGSYLFSSEFSIKYQLDEQTLVYLTLARSNKPSGVNVSASAQQSYMSPDFQDFTENKLKFGEELLRNKELGIKTRLLDQRLAVRAALFHTTRENAQLENWMWDDAAGLWIGYLDSTGDAESYGVELETSFDVNQSLQLFASLGWLETEVDSIEVFDLDLWAFDTKYDRDQAKAPSYQYSVGANVVLTEQLSATVSVEGRDNSYFAYYHDGQLDGYHLLNASLNYQLDNISITVWGRNLTDEDYAVHGLYFGADPRDNYGAWANETYLQYGEPKAYGVNASYSF